MQVLLQPQSPLTNPGRINKKHKGEEEEVHFHSESENDCTIGRISTNAKMCELEGVEKEFRQKMYIFGFCQVVSVITEGLPQVFGTNLVNGQVLQSFS